MASTAVSIDPSSSSAAAVSQVCEYRSTLEKCLKANDHSNGSVFHQEAREVLDRLAGMAMSVALLHDTKIGLLIAKLQRYPSDPGISEKATHLVKKWKRLVFPKGHIAASSFPAEAGLKLDSGLGDPKKHKLNDTQAMATSDAKLPSASSGPLNGTETRHGISPTQPSSLASSSESNVEPPSNGSGRALSAHGLPLPVWSSSVERALSLIHHQPLSSRALPPTPALLPLIVAPPPVAPHQTKSSSDCLETAPSASLPAENGSLDAIANQFDDGGENPSRKRRKTDRLDSREKAQVPTAFVPILENFYPSKSKLIKSEDAEEICSCIPSSSSSSSASTFVPSKRVNASFDCGEDCLNRQLMTECGDRCRCKHQCQNKRFQQRLYKKTKVTHMGTKGHGLLAQELIKKGEFIIEYCGEIFPDEKLPQKIKEYKNSPHHYLMNLSQFECIDATLKGNDSRFINHSCQPNAATQKWTVDGLMRIGIFAAVDIPPDTEITFDYQFERFGGKKVKCLCGTLHCRGFLGAKPKKYEVDDSVSPSKHPPPTSEKYNWENEFQSFNKMLLCTPRFSTEQTQSLASSASVSSSSALSSLVPTFPKDELYSHPSSAIAPNFLYRNVLVGKAARQRQLLHLLHDIFYSNDMADSPAEPSSSSSSFSSSSADPSASGPFGELVRLLISGKIPPPVPDRRSKPSSSSSASSPAKTQKK